jgi:hypothetical protein
MAEPTPYIVMGHGVEDVKNSVRNNNTFKASRIEVPDDVTVVTLAQCGDSTYEDQVCPFLDLFTDTDPDVKKMLQDPAKHKKALERRTGAGDLHIFKKGDYLPRFAVKYFAAMEDAVYKSGVYEYPIDTARLISARHRDAREPCPAFAYRGAPEPSGPVDRGLIDEIFDQAVYPTPDLLATTERTTYKGLSARLTRKFEDLFKIFEKKPAVYYYVICRSPFKSSERTIYGELPKGFPVRFLPAAFSIDKMKRILGFNASFVRAELSKPEDDRMYGGLELKSYMEAHPAQVPRGLEDLIEAIKPIQTRNELAAFEDLKAKVELLKGFDSTTIKNEELRELFESFRANFRGADYNDPSNYIEALKTRRRHSITQQAKYRGAEGGARRTRRARRRRSQRL